MGRRPRLYRAGFHGDKPTNAPHMGCLLGSVHTIVEPFTASAAEFHRHETEPGRAVRPVASASGTKLPKHAVDHGGRVGGSATVATCRAVREGFTHVIHVLLASAVDDKSTAESRASS
jgi:hypothetical protein